MKRVAAAMLLAGLALSASALDLGRKVVADPKDCPFGTTDVSAYYKLENGRFVRDGWACEMRSRN
jgi:hypothetical protein